MNINMGMDLFGLQANRKLAPQHTLFEAEAFRKASDLYYEVAAPAAIYQLYKSQ